jgi:hypothetical protein
MIALAIAGAALLEQAGRTPDLLTHPFQCLLTEKGNPRSQTLNRFAILRRRLNRQCDL